MSTLLRVLLVEDQEDDARLLVRELTKGGYEVVHERVDSAGAVENALARKTWDLVISDHTMPAFSGTDALAIVRRVSADLPFIFVSGSIGEDVAVEAMRAGAQDYVMKGNTRRLLPAIARELRDAEGRERERAAERRLREASEMLRSVVAATPAAIIATDLTGRVKLWNPAAERLFGWTEAEVLGKDNPTVPDDERDARVARRARALLGDSSTDFEAQRLRKDGSLIDVSVSVASTNDESDSPHGFTVVLQDLTERRRLEAQLAQAQKMEAIGRLAGGIAHDFNNLLTVITSYSDLLLENLGEGDPSARDLREIQNASRAGISLTRQLLAFSRQKVIEPRIVEMNDVVSTTISMFERLLDSRVTLREQLDPGTGLVRVDAGQLEQVIMNLVVNARDAMPDGGDLVIETRHVAAGEVHGRGIPAAEGLRGYALLSVHDTGTGMDEATKALIFEPFFTTKSPEKGTGLGLATVYGIVKQYDGTVRVESAPGAGTTFSIYLPSARKGSRSQPDGVPIVGDKRAGATILLVEDEPAVRAIARRVLESAGYVVLEAPDAQVAERIADTRTGAMQLLLTDVVLPGIDGEELARRIVRKCPETRVLFTSGDGEDSGALSNLKKSGHRYLRKPFQPGALVEAVRKALR